MSPDAPTAIGRERPIAVIRPRGIAGCLSCDEDCADVRAAAKVVTQAGHREVVAEAGGGIVGLHVQQADVRRSHATGEARAATDGNRLALVINANAAAEEHFGLP
jgi:hypothetical protein